MQGRLTLQRLDENTSLRDDLTYEYNTGTNRLRNTDPADGENYTYDEIGNLISDTEEGIAEIQWTPYGKVRKVEKNDNSSVSFRYDASGNRIAKIAGSDTTIYVRDASGNVMAIYRNDTLAEQSIYGSSRLGLMTASSKTGYRTLGGKKYELSNHLGNVLAIVSDNINLDQDSTWANVVNVTDYYPFGLSMEGRAVQDSSYRYGFTGHEKDDEIKGAGNHYGFEDYGYDPRISRRWRSDPAHALYPNISPYAYALNTPINAIDPDGKIVIFVNGYRGLHAVVTDLFDNGFVRRIYRKLSSERIYKADKYKYWGGMDDKFMDKIGDNKAIYADASSHALSTANYRYRRGKEAGETLLQQISAGDIKLQTDENGNVTETIKIVSHSQGSAYASGMSNVLTDAGYKVEVEYNIAPKQPGDIPEMNAVRRVQYGSDQDIIAPQSPMSGDVEQGGGPGSDGKIGGHLLGNFKNIFNIKKGQDGYVAPRKDIQSDE